MTRRWRARHRADVAAREQNRTFSEEQQLLRKARGYVSTYLRRGIIQCEPCGTCGRQDVVPHFADLTKPREVTWLCRAHRDIARAQAVELAAKAAAAKTTAAKQASWQSERERFALEFPQLAPELQATLRSEAAAAIAADPRLRHLPLNPGSPIMRQALIRAYFQWIEKQATDRSNGPCP